MLLGMAGTKFRLIQQNDGRVAIEMTKLHGCYQSGRYSTELTSLQLSVNRRHHSAGPARLALQHQPTLVERGDRWTVRDGNHGGVRQTVPQRAVEFGSI